MLATLTERRAAHLVLLAVLCATVFFWFLGETPFHNKGEPREALVVQDIVTHGNWLFPLKAGWQIPSKPPLFHWIGALASLAWGEVTEATIRFPSALLGALGVFLAYWAGAKLYDPLTGLLAGLMLATTFVYQNAATEARVDMTLAFFLALPLLLFFGMHQRILKNGLWWYLFFAIAGLGVLAKGPVSLILTGLIITAFVAIKNEWSLVLRLARHPGVLVGLAIFGGWYGIALANAGSEFATLQFVKENLNRFFVHGEDGTGHQKPLYYFFPYLFSLGLPWTLFLPPLLWSYFKEQWFKDDRALFFGLWVAVVLGFFSLSAGKRPPYILPLYLPLTVLIAVWCRERAGRTGTVAKSVLSVGWLAAGMGAMMLAVLGAAILWSGSEASSLLGAAGLQEPEAAVIWRLVQENRWPYWYLLGSAVLCFLAARNLLLSRMLPAVAQLGALGIVTSLVIQGFVAPVLADALSYREFVRRAIRTAPDAPLLLFPRGIDAAPILFYGGERVERIRGNLQTLKTRLSESDVYVILSERQWTKFRSEVPAVLLLQSRGRGANGDDPLVLVRGRGAEQASADLTRRR
ncbi:MAG TPA: glycosyltransferase family 39 protein [Candidatus Eisenbacteria bacterium]|nr:glycosyltransferase family 39 protein [Candidatus Eisenbacteria bacterium]